MNRAVPGVLAEGNGSKAARQGGEGSRSAPCLCPHHLARKTRTQINTLYCCQQKPPPPLFTASDFKKTGNTGFSGQPFRNAGSRAAFCSRTFLTGNKIGGAYLIQQNCVPMFPLLCFKWER